MGVLKHYVEFVQPVKTDSNKARWPVRKYWEKLIRDAEEIRLYTAPGVEYNLDRAESYLFGQAGGTLDCLIAIYGEDGFLKKFRSLVKRSDESRKTKYQQLVERERAKRDESEY